VAATLISPTPRRSWCSTGCNLLPQHDAPGFLCEALPPARSSSCSRKPCRLLDTLRLDRSPWAEPSLGGLTEAESFDFLNRHPTSLLDAEKDEIVQEANGYPLYLERAVRAAQAGRPWRARRRPHWRRATGTR